MGNRSLSVIALQRRATLAAAFAPQSPAGGEASARDVTALDSWTLKEPVSGKRWTLWRVRTRGGATGWGESAAANAAAVAAARAAVLNLPATAFEVARKRLAGESAAATGTQMAMLDAAGKMANTPVFRLLSGQTRFKVRALGALHGEGPADWKPALEQAAGRGFQAFLAPLPQPRFRNSGRAFLDAVIERATALRAAAGEGFDFVLDAAGALTPGDAGSAAGALERFHTLWLEEPCAPLNTQALRKIGEESVTPIGFGRSLRGPAAFQDLLRHEAADLLRPDLGHVPFTEIRRIAALAEASYVAVAPYHDGGPVATAAALQLAATLPNFFIQQIPIRQAPEDQRMRTELVAQNLETPASGYLTLPDRPGLGITINEAAIARYEEKAA